MNVIDWVASATCNKVRPGTLLAIGKPVTHNYVLCVICFVYCHLWVPKSCCQWKFLAQMVTQAMPWLSPMDLH